MRIAILGAGKMGAWMAVQLSKDNEIAVYDLEIAKAREAASDRIIVLESLDVLASFKPQMLINAVSLQHTIEAFRQSVKHLPKDCLICDVASIKTGLAEYYGTSGFRFASVHPMFGPTFSNLESLREENAIIIKGSDPQGSDFFRRFFESLGLRIFDYTFDEHDRMMAYSLTTPFVASLVFAACMERSAVPGSTFARHRRIAQGVLSEDDQLLSEILFNPHSLAQLDKITSKLEFLKHIIRGRDHVEMKRFLDKLRNNIWG